MRTSLGPYTKKWSPCVGLRGRAQTLSTGTGDRKEHQAFSSISSISGGIWMTSSYEQMTHTHDFSRSPHFIRINNSHHCLTTLRGGRTPAAVAQADGGTNPPQLEPSVAMESDACPRVVKHTLCGSMGGHRRPAASHHWVEKQAQAQFTYEDVSFFFN